MTNDQATWTLDIGHESLTPSVVKIGLIQLRATADPAENLRRHIAAIKGAARRGAQTICLQELFRTPYFPQREDSAHFALAEPLNGETAAVLSQVAKQFEVILIAPIFEKRAPGLYHNSALIIDQRGEVLSTYRKMHIPDDPCFHEKYYFTPGDLGFRSAATPFGKIGVLICWDQWYPEAARLTALTGAKILFYPTAIGWHNSELSHVREEQIAAWQVIHRAHAIANGVFVAAVNRVGVEEELAFWGASFVSDPAGCVIAEASRDKEEVLVVECNLSRIEEQRHGWPFLRDRRIDAYEGLLRRYSDQESVTRSP